MGKTVERQELGIIGWLTLGAAVVLGIAAYLPQSRINVQDYGAVGDGVTNDAAAVLAAVQAACPSGACNKAVYFPPTAGGYLISSSSTGSVLSLNTSTLGSDSGCVHDLHLEGDGGSSSIWNSFKPLSRLIIKDNSASIGLDMVGDGHTEVDHLGIEEPSNATGPTVLWAMGKSSTCDADIHHLHDLHLTTYTGQNTYAFFNYGAEDMKMDAINMDAMGGGGDVYLSAVNTLGVTSTVTLKAATPVSSTAIAIGDGYGEFATNGASSKPAYSFFLDPGNGNGTIAKIWFKGYCKNNGPADICVADGAAASSTTKYFGLNFDLRAELNYNGSNTEQMVALGDAVDTSTILLQGGEAVVSSSALIQIPYLLGSHVTLSGPNAGTALTVANSGNGSHVITPTGTTATCATCAELGTNNSDPALRALTLTYTNGRPSYNVSAISDPAAPVASVVGATGSQSYGPYYVVCNDYAGNHTYYSPSSNTIITGVTPLTSSNYIHIAWTGNGACQTWDVLKGNTTTSIATGLAAGTTSFNDQGGGTSAYTGLSRNTTGDVSSNYLISNGTTFAKLPSTPVNGARIYCSNCNTPANPPTTCASSPGTGAFAEGVNGQWICAY